jgi:heat shock protein HslJ
MRFGDGRVEGYGGCNRFTASYLQDSVGARAIAIRRIEMNRRLCDPGVQAVENRVLEALQAVSSYAITVDVMTMSGSAGTLRLRALAEEGGAPASLVGSRWTGVTDTALDKRAVPRLEFVSEGRVTGFTGCNLLSGAWRTDAGQVRMGALVTTKRACAGPEGEIEKRFVEAVNEEARVLLEGTQLIFTGPGGARFEFVEVK